MFKDGFSNFACLRNCLLTNTRTVIIKIKREYFILNLKMMQEASKRRCNKIKLLSLSFVSKLTFAFVIIIIKFVTNVKTLQQCNTTLYDMCDRNKEQNFHPNYYLFPLLTIAILY